MSKSRILVLLLAVIVIALSGCSKSSDDSRIKRPDFSLPEKSGNSGTPAPYTTLSPKEKPFIFKDEEGYIYAYKDDNFIIEYEGIIVKMYYKLTEHAFKGVIENTNMSRVKDLNLAIILDTGRKITIDISEGLGQNDSAEIASVNVASPFSGWRITLNDNPPMQSTNSIGKPKITVYMRITPDSFTLDIPKYPVIADFGIDIAGHRYAGVYQYYIFDVRGLSVVAHFSEGESRHGNPMFYLEILLENHSSIKFEKVKIAFLTNQDLEKKIMRTSTNEPIDLEPGEKTRIVTYIGQSIPFEIYRLFFEVYAGGTLQIADRNKMDIRVAGAPYLPEYPIKHE